MLVFSRDRFIEFDTLTRAAEWVADYIVSPESLFTLRAGLAADPRFTDLLRLDLADLVIELARSTIEGRLRWLLDPRNQLPWRWRLPETPSFEGDNLSGEEEALDLTSEAEEAEEQESEYEEVKPEPVIPPEFPRLAKREADTIDLAAAKMTNQMDLLRYVGEKPIPESAVAKAYPDLADSQASALDIAAGDAAGTLQGLVGTGGRPPKSGVAEVLPRMAKSSGDSLTDASSRLQTHTADLAAGADFEPITSGVADELDRTAARHGSNMVEQAVLAGQALDALDGPGAEAPSPSTVVPAFGTAVSQQTRSIADNARQIGESLAGLNQGEIEPPPASENKTVFQKAADGQIIVIESARKKANEVLDGLASTLDQRAEVPAPSGNAAIFQKDGERAGEKVGDAALASARVLDGLRPDDPAAEAAALAAMGPPRIQIEGPPGVSVAGLLFKIQLKDEDGNPGEQQVFVSDSAGLVELHGATKGGYDILGIEDKSGFEVAGLTTGPAPAASDAATDDAAPDEPST